MIQALLSVFLFGVNSNLLMVPRCKGKNKNISWSSGEYHWPAKVRTLFLNQGVSLKNIFLEIQEQQTHSKKSHASVLVV